MIVPVSSVQVSSVYPPAVTEYFFNAFCYFFFPLQRNKIIKHEVKKLQKEAAKK